MMKITLCTLLPLALAASAMAATSNEGTGSNVKDPATKAPIGDKAGDARKAKLPKGGNVKATQPKAGKGSLDLPPPSLDDPDHYFITISKVRALNGTVPKDMTRAWESLCQSVMEQATPGIPADRKSFAKIYADEDGEEDWAACYGWYYDAHNKKWFQQATDTVAKALGLEVITTIKLDRNNNIIQ